MRKLIILLAVFSLCIAPLAAKGVKRGTPAEKKARIDTMAQETLNDLVADSPGAQELLGKAVGYAVFDNLKLSLFISGGGGVGVAVNKNSGQRTYMKMGTAGLNIGLGGQKFQVVFLFQNMKTFNSFIDHGWQADANANAVAGTAGANKGTTFRNGMAVYQITQGGLMLQADVAGTKYWKSKKLN
jgi:lipid-binding SYLF domain-containing protein